MKTFLRQEIQYQRVTHHRDAEVRKDLYKVNNVSLQDMIENLTVMLSDEQNDEGVVFPSEEEVINILKQNLSLPVPQPEVNDAVCLLQNRPVAVIWDSKHKKKWYVGFFLDMNKDGTYRIDDLERKGPLTSCAVYHQVGMIYRTLKKFKYCQSMLCETGIS